MQFRELRRVLQSIVLAGLPMSCDIGILDTETVEPPCGGWTESGSTRFAVDLPADPPVTLRVESCRVDIDACLDLCRYVLRGSAGSITACEVELFAEEVKGAADYTIVHQGSECPGIGRRPAGLIEPRRSAICDSAIGRWFAHVAWLEAASIPAFIFLARELERFGAPEELIRAAVASAHDEVRHARIMSTLARRFGATPPPVELAPPPVRSLEALAIENAIEGCVNETWGAVTALWQARRAGAADLRAVFHGIAVDEARHAGLAWEIDRWVSTRLDASARVRVLAARAAAARALLETEHHDDIAMLGLPIGVDASGLLARMDSALWRAS